ncbi:MAG: toxic anion resistance protein [Candidatus Eremiobacteraeota bacterium]|nr:toxic anion resistance protein [Candidatus Eremiobacteraeota bacterium]
MTDAGSPNLPELHLTPPEPVPVVEIAQIDSGGPVKINSEDEAALNARVAGFIDDITRAPIDSGDFKARIDAITRLGDKEIEDSASVSSRLLERPVNAMSHSGASLGTSKVASGLVELRNTCERLDPKQQNLLSPNRLLGILPFGNRIKSYFRSYQSAQDHINAIMNSLMEGKDDLLRDNASIEQERGQMWSLMGRLEQFVYIAKKIDAELTARIAAIETTDPERAKQIKEQVLFDTRQKVTDLLTQMAVNVQGYMALDVIKRNNVELIKGVDRARTTTLSALRTAVIVASALSNQKLALDRITALKDTTGNLIASTGEMLKTQSSAIFTQASDPSVDVAKLQSAFDNVYATIDMIDNYKAASLGAMQQTVNALSGQVDKAKARLSREASGNR